MNDDFNTPILIAELFYAVKHINSVKEAQAGFTQTDVDNFKKAFNAFVFDILGLKSEADNSQITVLVDVESGGWGNLKTEELV